MFKWGTSRGGYITDTVYISTAYLGNTPQHASAAERTKLSVLGGAVRPLYYPFRVSKRMIRQVVSDFAVIIAILSMSSLDFYTGIPTPKLEQGTKSRFFHTMIRLVPKHLTIKMCLLIIFFPRIHYQVPAEFKPTLSTRGWVVEPFGRNPFWTAIVAVVPALLGTILIFMDQQITAVIVNRKEFKLKKGCGYHLDLFVLANLIIICSIMGLPWFVAATVLSINHVNSLKVESECAAPGEKPQFLGVRSVLQNLDFFKLLHPLLTAPAIRYLKLSRLQG
ncbi:unnamed protein product [Timema podura]|uniref:Bicarbonate transporter-like transmembrane domain-containing protein n=1 Tax=Timema podura TaxID=61482 RepID=A0ABN7NJK3_TIMPD|nr:unnamed protein product [Timema podura]